MPVAMSPSNVFPVVYTEAPTTESQSAFTWKQPTAATTPRAYRAGGRPATAPLKVSAAPAPSVAAEIDALKKRIASLQAKMSAAPPADAAPAAAPPAPDGGDKPWEGYYYDSFAKYASEASRVRKTGRLPFGKDRMKIDLNPKPSA
jgi:hypothetical protein